MALVESILTSCNAEQYVENFKKFGIDSYVLKILSDEDLTAIGIENERLRADILEHFAKLQIPTENKQDVKVDSQYAMLVLNLMSVHLGRHFENLSAVLKREDIDLCYVSNGPAVRYLERSLNYLEENVFKLESMALKTREKTKRKMSRAIVIASTIGITSLLLFTYAKFASINGSVQCS